MQRITDHAPPNYRLLWQAIGLDLPGAIAATERTFRTTDLRQAVYKPGVYRPAGRSCWLAWTFLPDGGWSVFVPRDAEWERGENGRLAIRRASERAMVR